MPATRARGNPSERIPTQGVFGVCHRFLYVEIVIGHGRRAPALPTGEPVIDRSSDVGSGTRRSVWAAWRYPWLRARGSSRCVFGMKSATCHIGPQYSGVRRLMDRGRRWTAAK